MFLRMIRGAFARQWKKMLVIALTIMLGTSLATAMINVMLDVGDKVNQELKTYGANITVLPKSASVMSDLYEMEDAGAETGSYLLESEIGNIKTIFWAFNIVDFTPFIDASVTLPDGESVLCHHARNAEQEAEWIASEIQKLQERGIPNRDITVLYRAHYISRSVEEMHSRCLGITFWMVTEPPAAATAVI